MMGNIWFCLVALMLAVYVILDGFDLGAGILHWWIARTEAERKTVIRSIGPVWDGNEVWLLAAGGTLYFAFPALYASSFSGFYLPLMIVLWLLVLRGVALEFRNKVESPVWKPLWDACFSIASLLLAVFFGAALGNVMRGVPLDASGRFFEPLWTDFRLGPEAGILDWYTILAGLTASSALVMHGAAWVALKTNGELQGRARKAGAAAWWGTAVLTAALTWATFRVQPQVAHNLATRPWGYVFPALALGGLAGGLWYRGRGEDRAAFLSSCAYLAGMLASAGFGLHPMVLPASTNAAYSLTVENAKAGDYGLKIGLVWWLVGMALVSVYMTIAYRNFSGKVGEGEDAGHESY